MRRILPLLCFLAACADTPQPPPPAAWIGRSEADLVASLGVPSRSYEVEGRRFVAYDTPVAAPGPAVVPSIGFGVGRSSGGWGSSTGFGTGLGLSFGNFGGTAQPCTTSFELQDGRVVGAARHGPGCG
ncbi:YdgH/BhsA/McbA family protein [Falsiroseomonas oryzae]|uniref:hypothetical protein n=1 Tax=Falsiroseomonas oryzae TaxID=2766473 RepID=UPI0022EB4B31|nr:hypothetical protein [Roseomonas sp. MO-31]